MTMAKSIEYWDMLEAVYGVGTVLKGSYNQAKEFLKEFFQTRFGSPPNHIEDHYPDAITLSFYENLEVGSSKRYSI